MLAPHANQLPSPRDRLTCYVKQHNRQILRVNVMLMGVTSSDVGGWLTRRLLFSSSLPSRQQLCWVKVWASSRRKTRRSGQATARQTCKPSLSVACVGFPLCNRDWFQNSPSKSPQAPPFFLFFFGILWKSDGKSLRDVFFLPLRRANISLFPRRLSLCVAYLAVKTHDLYTVFILEFMCYSDKATGFGVCVCGLYECLLRAQIVGLPTAGHKHYSVGMHSPSSSQSHSLSPAFPHEWWVFTTWPCAAV